MSSIKSPKSDDEKGVNADFGRGVVEDYPDVADPLEDREIFKKTHDGVDFRTVGWPRASVIFLKSMLPFHIPNHMMRETYECMIKLFSQPVFSVSQQLCTALEPSVVLYQL
jgi:hypothetical protein